MDITNFHLQTAEEVLEIEVGLGNDGVVTEKDNPARIEAGNTAMIEEDNQAIPEVMEVTPGVDLEAILGGDQTLGINHHVIHLL